VKRLLIVSIVIVAALAGAIVVRQVVEAHQETVEITQWANSHLMRDGLLPDMAKAFNRHHYKTSTGQVIKVEVVQCDSFVQTADLVSRVDNAGPATKHCKTTNDLPAENPTIVTPQSDDELINIDQLAGREVVDRSTARSIAETWLGIVTYRDMARCLGWPDKQLGYADLIELFKEGWPSHGDCASAEWGRPLLAFTNPSASTSGRNVLVSLYSIAAQEPPADLTVDDIDRPDVTQFVSEFNDLVDHYMSTTQVLMTKIKQGKKFGQFFLMPEDSLVNLTLGNEKAFAEDGTSQPLQGIPSGDLVMIYPKDGSVLNSNPGAIVSAEWVTPQQSEAANVWIEYLRSEHQQKVFGAAGFRPPSDTGLPVDVEQFTKWGLAPDRPVKTIEPGDLQPAVLERILSRWSLVKNSAIVGLLVDTSGSMDDGNRLGQVKAGLGKMIDTMSSPGNAGNSDQVALVTFSDTPEVLVRPQPLSQSKPQIADAIQQMKAGGNTALYDAIATGIELVDQAPGPDDAKRVLVVLTDGQANEGRCLSDIVSMTSSDERPVDFCGKNDSSSVDDEHIKGSALSINHEHEVQIFFVGFGDSDIAVGRILAQATGAEYQASTDEALATVIEQLSGYF